MKRPGRSVGACGLEQLESETISARQCTLFSFQKPTFLPCFTSTFDKPLPSALLLNPLEYIATSGSRPSLIIPHHQFFDGICQNKIQTSVEGDLITGRAVVLHRGHWGGFQGGRDSRVHAANIQTSSVAIMPVVTERWTPEVMRNLFSYDQTLFEARSFLNFFQRNSTMPSRSWNEQCLRCLKRHSDVKLRKGSYGQMS